jgi:hypothetical protein
MKFTLISEHEYGGPKITYEFEEDFLDDVVSNMEQFLKGSGFVYESLEVNQESSEDSSWDDDEYNEDDAESDPEFTAPFVAPDNNMSTTWPFPFTKPDQTVSTEQSET